MAVDLIVSKGKPCSPTDIAAKCLLADQRKSLTNTTIGVVMTLIFLSMPHRKHTMLVWLCTMPEVSRSCDGNQTMQNSSSGTAGYTGAGFRRR